MVGVSIRSVNYARLYLKHLVDDSGIRWGKAMPTYREIAVAAHERFGVGGSPPPMGKKPLRRYLVALSQELRARGLSVPPKPRKALHRPDISTETLEVEGVDVRVREFLDTRAWRTLRYRVLKEQGARCQCCGATPKSGAQMNIDHIKPRKTHPNLALDPDNLQVLCSDCNAGKGNWDSTDWTAEPERLTIAEQLDTEMMRRFYETGRMN